MYKGRWTLIRVRGGEEETETEDRETKDGRKWEKERNKDEMKG